MIILKNNLINGFMILAVLMIIISLLSCSAQKPPENIFLLDLIGTEQFAVNDKATKIFSDKINTEYINIKSSSKLSINRRVGKNGNYLQIFAPDKGISISPALLSGNNFLYSIDFKFDSLIRSDDKIPSFGVGLIEDANSDMINFGLRFPRTNGKHRKIMMVTKSKSGRFSERAGNEVYFSLQKPLRLTLYRENEKFVYKLFTLINENQPVELNTIYFMDPLPSKGISFLISLCKVNINNIKLNNSSDAFNKFKNIIQVNS